MAQPQDAGKRRRSNGKGTGNALCCAFYSFREGIADKICCWGEALLPDFNHLLPDFNFVDRKKVKKCIFDVSKADNTI